MELLFRILESAGIAIGVPLFLFLLAKLFPYKPLSYSEAKIDFAELQAKYARWEAAALIPFFAFSFLGGYLIFKGLAWLSQHSFPQTENTRFLMLPDVYFFGLPALFSGILVGVIPADLLFRLLFSKKRYAEFTLYSNLKNGYDGSRVMNFLVAIILVPSVIISSLAIDCYARFTDDKMVTNRFWGIGEEIRSYQQISSIKQVQKFKAPNGNIVESPYYIISFQDGSTWSSRNVFYGFPKVEGDEGSVSRKEAELMVFIALKTKKEVTVQEFED